MAKPTLNNTGKPAGSSGRTRPVRTRTQEVQDKIMDFILTQNLQPGDIIPSEGQLIDITGASRSAVREALKIMETLGIVEIKRGNGTYVGKPGMQGLTLQLTFASRQDFNHGAQTLLETIELREIIECGLARQMCLVAEQNLGVVWEVVSQMTAEALTGGVQAETDRKFHSQLYKPVANGLVDPLLMSLFEAYHAVKLSNTSVEENLASVGYHMEIVRAIEARDPERSAQAVINHFDQIRLRIQGVLGAQFGEKIAARALR